MRASEGVTVRVVWAGNASGWEMGMGSAFWLCPARGLRGVGWSFAAGDERGLRGRAVSDRSLR